MTVAQSFDDPSGLEIDKDGVVVRGMRLGQYTGDTEFERVGAGEIESVGRRRGQGDTDQWLTLHTVVEVGWAGRWPNR